MMQHLNNILSGLISSPFNIRKRKNNEQQHISQPKVRRLEHLEEPCLTALGEKLPVYVQEFPFGQNK